MSFLNGLMNLGRKANFTRGSVVAAKDIITAKVNITDIADMASVSKLLRSPQADKFVLSAKKQNAEIIKDVICKPYDLTLNRVITKRLPSGSTITTVYDNGFGFIGKEIINKKGRVVSIPRTYDGQKYHDVFVENYITGQRFLSTDGEKLSYVKSSLEESPLRGTLTDVLNMIDCK